MSAARLTERIGRISATFARATRCRRAARARVLGGALAVLALRASLAGAQGILIQGIADGEFWSTNASSNLLTRNLGRPAGLARLELWGAYEPIPKFVIYAQGEFEGGPARQQEENEVYTDQFGARYLASPAFVVDVGRFTPIIGTFATRHFSTRNPLIGEPDGYSTDYPVGIKVSGEGHGFDYRAGLVSLPTTHVGYEPEPTSRLRPAIGGGYTPIVGLRFGASFTRGPYLSKDLPNAALNGRPWTDYQQSVIALDAQFSRGYLETHAEAARGAYDIAGRSAITGFTYYGEAKYTFTPRFFLATRLERNKYPFIRPTTTVPWTARLIDFVDGEFGVGYRLTSSTILKTSIRGDKWWVRPGTAGYRGTSGRAFAVQLSQAFDVMNWVDRARLRE
jgi:hypothetical protein